MPHGKMISVLISLGLMTFALSCDPEPPERGGDTWGLEQDGTTEGGDGSVEYDDGGLSKGWETTAVQSRTEGAKLDIFWVIDNSQSMCQEQRQLRDNFKNFITTLREKPVDFHISVTTTHREAPFEKIADFGEIQSTPHPVVGFADRCRYGVDTSGMIQKDDFSPVREQIRAAINCTKSPGKFSHLENLTEEEIRCALTGGGANDNACQKAGKDPSKFGPEQLFPCGDKFGKACSESEFKKVYRDIPKVIKASDPRYQTANGVDFDKLQKDFACMSFVGTRGDSVEQGLRAATEAVSLSKTGGPVEAPKDSSAPNHGFLRKDAKLAVIFVTDENDCSHPDDKKSELNQKACGDLGCYFATKGDDQSPLIPTSKLADDFMSNLAESKGVEKVSKQDVLFASIHGDYEPYAGKIYSQCKPSDFEKLEDDLEVCATELGSARSGDRYEDFLLNFPNIFPKQPSGGGHLKGWMCDGRLQPALEAMASEIKSKTSTCMTGNVASCGSDSECPDYQWREKGQKVCRAWGSSGRNYCDSALQVRLQAKNAGSAKTDLEKTGLCVPESIDAKGLSGSCVVEADAYSWIACPEGDGLALEWSNLSDPERQLAGFDVRAAYRTRR